MFASCRLLAAGATVTVVRARPEMGCMWAKVCGPGQGAPGVFVALCYMPCETSEYYRQWGLSKETHWEGLSPGLRRDAADFGDKGSVLIMGDLNGRTGTESSDAPYVPRPISIR